MPVLEIQDLNVYYGELQALFDVNLDVHKGRIVSVLGANGAGKSTLLKSISGLLQSRSGWIVYDGKRIDGLPPHRIVDMGLSLVPEGRKIFSSLTVRENLMIGSYSRKARPQSRETLENILTLFPSLDARISQKGTDLSGGEQQMLAIGRALMSCPRFIIFDEISLGLSPLVVKELYRAVKRINQEGMSVVLVEQDVRRSLKAADFTYILQEGKITLQGNPRHLTEETVKKAYFGV
jgi:branched-chain amino acid transport system ATP-binding protein